MSDSDSVHIYYNPGTPDPIPLEERDVGYEISLDLRNSVISGSSSVITSGGELIADVTSAHNNFSNVDPLYLPASTVSDDGTNTEVAPAFQYGKYGLGSYLLHSEALLGTGEEANNLGAEILYRYQNGERTKIPLWPWPMEERIFRDLGGYHVTLHDFGEPDVDKRGIWESLDGLYPSCE